jgi:hypothetical protein
MSEKCLCGFYVHVVTFMDGSVHYLCSRGHIDQTAQTKLSEVPV